MKGIMGRQLRIKSIGKCSEEIFTGRTLREIMVLSAIISIYLILETINLNILFLTHQPSHTETGWLKKKKRKHMHHHSFSCCLARSTITSQFTRSSELHHLRPSFSVQANIFNINGINLASTEDCHCGIHFQSDSSDWYCGRVCTAYVYYWSQELWEWCCDIRPRTFY